jgi:hypothetical protein
MDRGRVGKDRGSKETDGCPLTLSDKININLEYHVDPCRHEIH